MLIWGLEMNRKSTFLPLAGSILTALFAGGAACGTSGGSGGNGAFGGGGGTGGGIFGDSSLGGTTNTGGQEAGIIVDVNVEATPPCKGLQCEIPSCSGGATTSISGTVFAPNGELPLYNVIVYVPLYRDVPLEPITLGATCDKCNATIKNTVRTALTDHEGKFTLEDVPAGVDIPLVMQVGKWRRQVKLSQVQPCQDNVLSDPQQTRLPRDQVEGDIPQMAITTGGCDPLACLFRKMGLADSEFTAPTSGGRMHVYKGVGGGDVAGGIAPAPWDALWNSVANLSKYDITILSCECSEQNTYKTTQQREYLRDYLNLGGRVFATHYHYTWFKNGVPEFQALADWQSAAGTGSSPFTIDTSFPKGMAFMQWLQVVSSTVTGDQINITSVASDLRTVSAGAQRWIYKPAAGANPEGVKYFTFNTPVGADAESQCGRAVMSDIHVSSGSQTPVPTACNSNALTDQEKALIFLYFDLSSCIQPDDEKPVPPPVPQ